MKIVPASGPVIEANTGQSPSQMAARDRAVAKLSELQGLPPQAPKASYPPNQRPPMNVAGHPVNNPTTVAPEEVSALTSEVQKPEDETIQDPTIEAAADSLATTEEVTEASPKEVTKVPEEAPQLSSQYAQLARQTKAFRAQQVQMKAYEGQIKAREEAIKAKEAEMHSQYVPKAQLAKDPVKVLQEQGFTPEQITNMLLNQPDPAQQQQLAVIERLEAKIKALEDGQESTKKSFEDSQKQSYTQAINMIKNEASHLVDSDANFETIKATNSVDDVVELITKTFETDGKLLTVQEAAEAVEDYLVEEALKIARLKKIQDRLKPAPAQAKPAATVPAQAGAPKPATKTLTSGMNNTRPLTAKERAILAFKGELHPKT